MIYGDHGTSCVPHSNITRMYCSKRTTCPGHTCRVVIVFTSVPGHPAGHVNIIYSFTPFARLFHLPRGERDRVEPVRAVTSNRRVSCFTRRSVIDFSVRLETAVFRTIGQNGFANIHVRVVPTFSPDSERSVEFVSA